MIIEGNTLEGEYTLPITNIVNLSSCPNEFLVSFIQRITAVEKIPKVITLIPMRTHSNPECKLIAKSRSVYTVVDEDDSYADIKIMNLRRVIKFMTIKKITIKARDIDSGSQRATGNTAIVITPHARKNLRELHAAQDSLSGDHEEINVANLIQPDSKVIGSIAGMRWYLWNHGVAVRKHIVSVEPINSWLMLPKKLTSKINAEDSNTIHDIVPENDRRWQYRAGYTDMLYTTYGPKKIKIQVKQKSTMRKIVEGICKIVRETFKWIINTVSSVFGKKNNTKAKTRNTGLRFSPITNTLPYVYTLGSHALGTSISDNAQQQIDKANSMMARWHVNRMAQKPTASSDKTKLLTEIPKQMATYIVGVLGFNTQEAVITADMQAAKECLKKRSKLLLMNLIICIIATIFYGSVTRIVIMALATLVGHLANTQLESIIICGIIAPTNLLNKIILAVLLATETNPGISRSIKKKLLPWASVVVVVAQIIFNII